MLRAAFIWMLAAMGGLSWVAPARVIAATTGGVNPCTISDHDWTSLVTQDRKARIWWPRGDRADAAAAHRDAGDLDVIWPKFAGLLGRQPDPTHHTCLPVDDGRLQILLSASVVRAFTRRIGTESPGGPSAAYIELAPGEDRDVVAHELFHAFQDAFHYARDLDSYTWFDEGSAAWAEYYAYPQDHGEPSYDKLLTDPQTPLDSYTSEDDSYNTWLYDLYLHKTEGASTITKILGQFDDNQVDQGVDRGSGTFLATWPKFALAAWNQAPDPAFQKWDKLFVAPVPQRSNLTLDGAGQATVNAPDKFPLKPLARDYTEMDLIDSSIRYLQFDNTLDGTRGASVQAFVKLENGRWSTQDWTDRSSIDFCRDQGNQNVSEIVVIYANSALYTGDAINPSSGPTIKMRNYCSGVQGTFSGSVQLPDEGTLSWTGNATLATPGTSPDNLELTSGTVSWSMSGQDGSGCTWSGSGTVDLTPGRDGVIQFHPDGTYYLVLQSGPPDAQDMYLLPVTQSCPGQGATSSYAVWETWLATREEQPASGTTLSGSNTYENASVSWNLTSYTPGG